MKSEIINNNRLGKTISIFLSSASHDAPRRITMSGWSGRSIYSTRSNLDQISGLNEKTDVPGVYILMNQPNKKSYIGQSDKDVLGRIREHIRKKDWWTEVVFFYGDDIKGATECFYIENKLIDIARAADHYTLANGIGERPRSVDPSIRDASEDFISKIKLVLFAQGFLVLEKKMEADVPKTGLKPDPIIEEEPGTPFDPPDYCQQDKDLVGTILYIIEKECKAEARIIEESENNIKLEVLAGSRIHSKGGPNYEKIPEDYKKIKDLLVKLETAGTIKDNVFTQNYRFDSPSGAAAFLLKSSVNGWSHWKDKSGKQLQEIKVRSKVSTRK